MNIYHFLSEIETNLALYIQISEKFSKDHTDNILGHVKYVMQFTNFSIENENDQNKEPNVLFPILH